MYIFGVKTYKKIYGTYGSIDGKDKMSLWQKHILVALICVDIVLGMHYAEKTKYFPRLA